MNKMISPYKSDNLFYIHNIPFRPLSKRGNSINCRIGDSKQLVFIPLSYFDIDNKGNINIKENVNLEWFYNKKDTQNKIKIFLNNKKVSDE